jgi:hypothetical protein
MPSYFIGHTRAGKPVVRSSETRTYSHAVAIIDADGRTGDGGFCSRADLAEKRAAECRKWAGRRSQTVEVVTVEPTDAATYRRVLKTIKEA